ncbi:MAG: hypothetical protein FWE98_02955 [Oscillospiraceae bacterium]|nr:hypothetical protein [Oscillospiraceae bacterium]
MIKRQIAAFMTIVFMLGVFSACGEAADSWSSADYHPLIINIDKEPRMFVSYELQEKFWHDLTSEQVTAVLPGFEKFAKIKSATAAYEIDSWMNHVKVEIERTDEPNFRTSITLRKNAIRNTEKYQQMLFDITYWEIKGFEISNVHGIPVVSEYIGNATFGGYYEFDINETIQLYEFTATFLLNGIIYHISLYDYPASIEYNECLEMLVNEIILTSVKARRKPKLKVLDNPEVPELRDERITLEEAYADPDFGAYIPKTFPESLAVDNARRFINQSLNSLYIFGKPKGIGQVFWSVHKFTEYDLANIVSLEEREKYDIALYPEAGWMIAVPKEFSQVFQHPIFRAEDMSFETVMTRTYNGSVKSFGVLIDDIVVAIDSYAVSPEQAWEMLQEVIKH